MAESRRTSPAGRQFRGLGLILCVAAVTAGCVGADTTVEKGVKAAEQAEEHGQVIEQRQQALEDARQQALEDARKLAE